MDNWILICNHDCVLAWFWSDRESKADPVIDFDLIVTVGRIAWLILIWLWEQGGPSDWFWSDRESKADPVIDFDLILILGWMDWLILIWSWLWGGLIDWFWSDCDCGWVMLIDFDLIVIVVGLCWLILIWLKLRFTCVRVGPKNLERLIMLREYRRKGIQDDLQNRMEMRKKSVNTKRAVHIPEDVSQRQPKKRKD